MLCIPEAGALNILWHCRVWDCSIYKFKVILLVTTEQEVNQGIFFHLLNTVSSGQNGYATVMDTGCEVDGEQILSSQETTLVGIVQASIQQFTRQAALALE